MKSQNPFINENYPENKILNMGVTVNNIKNPHYNGVEIKTPNTKQLKEEIIIYKNENKNISEINLNSLEIQLSDDALNSIDDEIYSSEVVT